MKITLEKATETLKEILERGSMIDDEDDDCAIKLGIEALKLYKVAREQYPIIRPYWLPGETEA